MINPLECRPLGNPADAGTVIADSHRVKRSSQLIGVDFVTLRIHPMARAWLWLQQS